MFMLLRSSGLLRNRALSLQSLRKPNECWPVRLLSCFSSWREEVLLKDGRKAWVHERKAGWVTVSLVDAQGGDQFIKVRKADFQVLPSVPSAQTEAVETSKVVEEAKPFVLTETPVPALHSRFTKWIIFSDLHVKGSSIETCEEVLAAVHEAAVARGAGILFLGDFWHVRGSLNVELLNRVLRALRAWTQPVIMIPGNHDQVTLGGSVHALEPLLYAFRPEQILMLSEPTVCMGALWIPYRRDPALMRAILAAGAAHPGVSMVFCHADVKGAFMNDGMRSREGLDIGMFPPRLPIYSGHFHKPHTMSRDQTSLRYVGSPYQTSLSEAGQDKYLYCMSSAAEGLPGRWAEDSRWTLSVGRRYIRAASAQDPSLAAAVRGDRVVIPVRAGEDYEAEALSVRLRERGVEVELRHERLALPSIGGAAAAEAGGGADLHAVKMDELDPLRVFGDYMGSVNVSELLEGPAGAKSREALSDVARLALHSAIVEEGKATVERLMSSSQHNVSDHSRGSRLFDLKLDRLRLSNFGPYGGEPVEYPLSQRGLVLIRGQSTDGTGADSNGSGKTTLAMSVMWGLSGSLDARLVADGRAADVAFDSGAFSAKGKAGKPESEKRTAEVGVWGTINERPFEVIRRRGAKKSELFFRVDGVDRTTQSVKDTQILMDQELGIGGGLLQRCCFFGQHSHTLQSLLGLTDVKLKSELSALVSTDIWERALRDVKERDRADRAQVNDLGVEVRVRGEELSRLRRAAEEGLAAIRAMENQLSVLEKGSAGGGESVTTDAPAGESLTELMQRYSALQSAIASSKQLVLEPLRKDILQSALSRTSMLASVDKPIQQLMQRTASLSSAKRMRETTLAAQKAAQTKTVVQHASIVTSLSQQMVIINDGENGAVLAEDVGEAATLRKCLEEAQASVTSLDVKIRTASKSLVNIVELKTGGAGCNVHGLDECPTCGQEMPAGTRETREADLRQAVAALTSERAAAVLRVDSSRKRYEAGLKVKGLLQQRKEIGDRMAEQQRALAEEQEKAAAGNAELAQCEGDLVTKRTERDNLDRELNRIHAEKTRQLEAAGVDLAGQEAEEVRLRRRVDELRKAETLRQATAQSSSTHNAAAVALRNKIQAAGDAVGEKNAEVLRVQSVINRLEETKKGVAERAAVMERLAAALGPRGIQNYVFQGVLRQIESIANSYLTVLADGGIQLTLQGQEDSDKIVKSVLIRGASDGVLRERGLSQLSGGQWRRVSMALDLAFAEVIRRRGILRSNLVVMDEVLTHLDSSGREAVGTVLRAMVEGPRPGDDDDDAAAALATDDRGARVLTSELSGLLLGGGAYETVLVILQDLAAVELEEAFDCVDVVEKLADTARVIVDDGH